MENVGEGKRVTLSCRGSTTHQRPQGEHVHHVFAHFGDGREIDGIPIDGLGHPHGMAVHPSERCVNHEPDDGRGRPAADADRRRKHDGTLMMAGPPRYNRF